MCVGGGKHRAVSRRWVQGSSFNGISAFHTQLISDTLWVLFLLLLAGTDPLE